MKKSGKGGFKYIIGIDEAGRGPLAGPVAVGAVMAPSGFSKKILKGVRDSKKLSEKLRESWFLKLSKESLGLRFSVSFAGSSLIDKKGISAAVRVAVKRCLEKLEAKPEECFILLDGALKAPKKFIFQKTIIGGDDLEPIISIASIVAKVKRDRKMLRLARIYPEYGFGRHKGYGTAEHCRTIRKRGLCRIHRRSFVKNLLGGRTAKQRSGFW